MHYGNSMSDSERDAEREQELEVLASAPDDVRPPLLVCPKCKQTEPHTKFRIGGPWMLVCWGCSHVRAENADGTPLPTQS